MRQYVYAALNRAIQTAWAAISPATPVVFDHPIQPASMPASGLRVYWFGFGGPSGLGPDQDEAVIQLDIFMLGAGEGRPVAAALAEADALDAALIIQRDSSLSVITVLNTATGADVGRINIKPDSAGWQNVGIETKHQMQLSRRIIATWDAL